MPIERFTHTAQNKDKDKWYFTLIIIAPISAPNLGDKLRFDLLLCAVCYTVNHIPEQSE